LVFPSDFIPHFSTFFDKLLFLCESLSLEKIVLFLTLALLFAVKLRMLRVNCPNKRLLGKKGLTYKCGKVICAPRSADELKQS
jgi:hypothetical protein